MDYDGQQWDICATTEDTNSFFHAVFGEIDEQGQSYDKMAQHRRMNWTTYLRYYETRPKPRRLVEALRDCFKEQGWSIDNDDDFKKYVTDVENGRQIHPDELLVLASLENVNIVVFKNPPAAPDIISPVAEILESYPLTNKSPLSTAVIFLEGKLYLKLKPISKENELKENKNFATYRRHPGYIAGLLYEINLLTVVLLNVLGKYDTWRLSSNNRKASRFDDVVLEWGPSKDALLIQAKWKQRKLTVTNLFGNKYSDFSLCKYFFAYEDLKSKFKVSNVVLCTNTEFHVAELVNYLNVRLLDEGDLLYLEGVDSFCFTFRDTFIQLLSEKLNSYECLPFEKHIITEENVRAFLNHLQLVVLPVNEKTFEGVIEHKILSMGVSGKYDCKDYARHLNKKIVEWYDKSSRYLTPLDSKVIFCGLKSDKIVEKLKKLEIDFKPGRLHLPNTNRVLHVVPRNDKILSLLKTCKFLENGQSQALYLSTNESDYNQKLTAEAFESRIYSYLVVYVTNEVRDVRGMCDRIVLALNKYINKKVILIGDRRDKLAEQLRMYNEKVFELVEDNITFTDFSEKSQEELLEKAILFCEASL